MDSLTKKTLAVSRGFTYTYYVSPATDNKPTLLLQHGFPDDASEWSDLITKHLVPAGYGVVAPDLLGYSGTSKPTSPSAFKFRGMVRDLTEILDAEGVARVVSLGHDWGSAMAQMFHNLAPQRTSGLVMVNVAYMPPNNAPFDLDAVLEQTKAVYGYGTFWYWKVFTAPDGAELCQKNLDTVFDLLHSTPEVWRKYMCEPDNLRALLEAGDGAREKIPVLEYATPAMREQWKARMTRDGIESPLCWYKASTTHEQVGEFDEGNAVVAVPTFFVAYDKDVVCRKENIEIGKRGGLLPHLDMVEFEGTHWALWAKPQEFGKAVVGWLEKTYAGSKL